MMSSNSVTCEFPPISYCTSYELHNEIQQYIKAKGSGVKEKQGRSFCKKQNTCEVDNGRSNGLHNLNCIKKLHGGKDDHSLLKFLARNAIELTAPATDILLRHNNVSTINAATSSNVKNTGKEEKKDVSSQKSVAQPQPQKPNSWFQLSGHPDCFAPAGPGTIWKKCSGGTERAVYEALFNEPALRDIVPRYLREVQYGGETFIELQDLLHGFQDPNMMDIKMGTRTFLESEVQNTYAREDLFLKMIAVDPNAPTPEEYAARAVTKLRYMQFRAEQSSTSNQGFRIEALKFRGSKPVTDLQKVKSREDVSQTLLLFFGNREDVRQRLIARLKEIYTKLEQSYYFKTHEIVGSSIFVVYDDTKLGAWLIDFAKTRPAPPNTILTHRLPWSPGNHEEGFLFGMEQLITILEDIKINGEEKQTTLQNCTSSVALKS